MSPTEVNARLKLAIESFKADIDKLEALAARVSAVEERLDRIEHYIKAVAIIDAHRPRGEELDPVTERKQLLANREMAKEALREILLLLLQVMPESARAVVAEQSVPELLRYVAHTISSTPDKEESDGSTAEGVNVLATVAEYHKITKAELGL